MREANIRLLSKIDKKTTKFYTLPDSYTIIINLESESIFTHKPNKLIRNIKLECTKKDISLQRITFEEMNGVIHDEIEVFNSDRISFQEICEYLVKYFINK